jgi:hypothetical protein
MFAFCLQGTMYVLDSCSCDKLIHIEEIANSCDSNEESGEEDGKKEEIQFEKLLHYHQLSLLEDYLSKSNFPPFSLNIPLFEQPILIPPPKVSIFLS